MKISFLFLIIFPASASHFTDLKVIVDTIPPPPVETVQIYGPTAACTGETSVYTVDVPIDCTCQWAVNGVVQPGTSPILIMEWTIPGNYIVSVIFIDSGGQFSEPLATLVSVKYLPAVDLGNDTTIMQGETLLLDAGNPGSAYLWSTGETTQTILVSLSGSYSVNVSNSCGSDSDTIGVFVFIGIEERPGQSDCIVASSSEKEIKLIQIPDNVIDIQVITMSGEIVYSGIPVRKISVKSGGIYLIKGITTNSTCCKKILVP